MALHILEVRGSGYGGGAAGRFGITAVCKDASDGNHTVRVWYRKSTGAGLFARAFGAKLHTVHSGFITKADHSSAAELNVTMSPQNAVKTRAHAAYFLYWKKAG